MNAPHDPAEAPPPELSQPRTVNDLFHYRLARLEGFCGAIVTRLCEGEFGITRREWRFIALLSTLGETTPKVLAAEANLDRGCTSRALAALEDKQLIVRQAARHDGRGQQVRLSAQGQRLHDDIFAALAAMNREILDAVPEAELPRLSDLLATLEARAGEVFRATAGRAQADRRHGGSRARWESRESPVPGEARWPK